MPYFQPVNDIEALGQGMAIWRQNVTNPMLEERKLEEDKRRFDEQNARADAADKRAEAADRRAAEGHQLEMRQREIQINDAARTTSIKKQMDYYITKGAQENEEYIPRNLAQLPVYEESYNIISQLAPQVKQLAAKAGKSFQLTGESIAKLPPDMQRDAQKLLYAMNNVMPANRVGRMFSDEKGLYTTRAMGGAIIHPDGKYTPLFIADRVSGLGEPETFYVPSTTGQSNNGNDELFRQSIDDFQARVGFAARVTERLKEEGEKAFDPKRRKEIIKDEVQNQLNIYRQQMNPDYNPEKERVSLAKDKIGLETGLLGLKKAKHDEEAMSAREWAKASFANNMSGIDLTKYDPVATLASWEKTQALTDEQKRAFREEWDTQVNANLGREKVKAEIENKNSDTEKNRAGISIAREKESRLAKVQEKSLKLANDPGWQALNAEFRLLKSQAPEPTGYPDEDQRAMNDYQSKTDDLIRRMASYTPNVSRPNEAAPVPGHGGSGTWQDLKKKKGW